MGNRSKVLWLTCLGLLGTPVYALNFGLAKILARIEPFAAGGTAYSSYLFQLVPLSIFYLVAFGVVFHSRAGNEQHPQSLVVVLFFAVLYRALLVPTAPVLSTDLYRYLWDGRVQAHGINPYRYAPDDAALTALRDQAVYPLINRPGSPTIYPAGAQILFRALHETGIRSPSALKAVVALFDMGSICVLILILMHFRLPADRVLVYAWHPLVLYELAGNGHLDGVMLFFVLVALLLFLKGRPVMSVAGLALATALKLYPMLLLPALVTGKKLRLCLVFGIVLLALYLPYRSAGGKILGFLPEYFKNPNESYNLGIKAYLLDIFPASSPLAITAILAAALSAAAIWVWSLPKDPLSAVWFAYMLAGLLFVLASGSMQPWYVVLVIPFLALFFSPAWLYFSFAICLSYLTFLSAHHAPPEWVRAVEYVPFLILLSVEYISVFRKGYIALESYRRHTGLQ